MEEGDKVVAEEADSSKADTTKNKPANAASSTGKTLQTRQAECLVEGAIMPD